MFFCFFFFFSSRRRHTRCALVTGVQTCALPISEPPMRWLQLPEQYLVTSIGSQAGLAPYLEKLALVLQQGIELVQFREPAWASASEAETYAAFQRIVHICHDDGVRCLVNRCHPESRSEEHMSDIQSLMSHP